MSVSNQELLDDAIARNIGLVLSLPSAGMLRHHKSRFLAPSEEGIWVESAPSEGPLIEGLIQCGQPAGFSFRSRSTRMIFASLLLHEEASYRVNHHTTRALLISRPDPALIKTIQRRANYRVTLTKECGLTARVWTMPLRTRLCDKPMRTAEVFVEPRDLGVGGLGIIVRPNKQGELNISTEDRLRIEITYKQVVLLMEGRMRPPNEILSTPDSLFTGIQFKERQFDLESKKQFSRLTGILGELQRVEIRRHHRAADRANAKPSAILEAALRAELSPAA